MSPSNSAFVKFHDGSIYPKMINQLFTTRVKDLTTVQRCLLEAELLLMSANVLAQSIKKDNPNLDEFASNVADSLHYCTEALNQFEG